MGFSVSAPPNTSHKAKPSQKAPSRKSHSAPTNTYLSSSGYIFRLKIPKDLKNIVGKVEFRYSLRTGSLRIAKQRSGYFSSYIQQLFSRLRSGMVELTQDQINELVKKYIKETLANDEKCRAIAAPFTEGQTTLEGKTVLESSDMGVEEAASLTASVDHWLKVKDYSLMNDVAVKIANSISCDISTDSASFKILSRELLKGFRDVLKVRAKRAKGDYSKTDAELVPVLQEEKQQVVYVPAPVQPVMVGNAAQEEPASMLFTEVQARYVVEMEKGGNWTDKTKEENERIYELFVTIEGDIPVDKITRQFLSAYKDKLMRIPPNLYKMKEYRGISVEQVIASNPEKTLAVNSINKYIRRMSGMFNYAVKNGFMLSNPADGMQIRRSKRADKERGAYTKEDLIKIFNSPEYLEDKHRHIYCKWTPLIALYTGCRLEEICQLHLEDIREEEGVLVFDINDKQEKKVKTLSSIRLVPVHPRLIEHGFMEYVAKLRAKGEQRLFPELRQRRDGYGQTVSKWFQRYKAKCGIEEGKTFHSFRHTFITHLKHKQVEPYMIHELDGHTIDSETMGRYGKRYTPAILLNEAILKIDYGL